MSIIQPTIQKQTENAQTNKHTNKQTIKQTNKQTNQVKTELFEQELSPPSISEGVIDLASGSDVEAEADGSIPEQRLKRQRRDHTATPASSVTRTKVYTSPWEILSPISPPGCLISLSHTDHRFKATWKKTIKCDEWVGQQANLSFSHVFTKNTWKDALTLVHGNAWDKWYLGKDHNPELELPPGMEAQEPGVIPEFVFDQLKPRVMNLGERKQYYR